MTLTQLLLRDEAAIFAHEQAKAADASSLAVYAVDAYTAARQMLFFRNYEGGKINRHYVLLTERECVVCPICVQAHTLRTRMEAAGVPTEGLDLTCRHVRIAERLIAAMKPHESDEIGLTDRSGEESMHRQEMEEEVSRKGLSIGNHVRYFGSGRGVIVGGSYPIWEVQSDVAPPKSGPPSTIHEDYLVRIKDI